ncbi:hypothetical protein B566_EDAN010973 [Ephemera danica]|nr:hypothetical protein B566_EDAN010973 [Ephemera danica]
MIYHTCDDNANVCSAAGMGVAVRVTEQLPGDGGDEARDGLPHVRGREQRGGARRPDRDSRGIRTSRVRLAPCLGARRHGQLDRHDSLRVRFLQRDLRAHSGSLRGCRAGVSVLPFQHGLHQSTTSVRHVPCQGALRTRRSLLVHRLTGPRGRAQCANTELQTYL